MKEKLRNNLKFVIGIMCGLTLSVSIAYGATAIIESREVNYDNEKSHGKYDNVQESIDELYERAGYHQTKWVDPVLKGNDPVFDSGSKLKPVVIEDNGTVYYANENTEWYNYSEKRWANAVILVDEPKNQYQVGDKIDESDIESYFVWIPKFKYKIWNAGNYTTAPDGKTLTNTNYNTSTTLAMNNARTIEIEFQGSSDADLTNNTVGQFLTHPAFKLGNNKLKGFWIGKFETGYSGASSASAAAVDKKDSTKVIIKPDVYSWRGMVVSNMFETAYNYERTLDSHMLKNTEWGAVAYLSHSIYGIGKEVNINNASDYKTGYAAAPNTDQSSRTGDTGTSSESTKTQKYNTLAGYLASTTGNITGVYDMSGGAWEYVAAAIEGKVGNSGFTSENLSKYMNDGYIDKYDSSSTITSYNKRILGDATGEMGPFYQFYDKDGTNRYHNSWFADYSNFVDSGYPWFYRGGLFSDGGIAGQFYFHRDTGEARGGDGFRVALAIK